MATTRRRGAEESKPRSTPSRSSRRTKEEEIGLGEMVREKLYGISFLFKSVMPSWGLLLFWLFSALESCFFYIYVSLFSPFMRPLVFEGQGHKMLLSYLGSQGVFPVLEKYQVIGYIDQAFEWLGAWDQTNQLRFLAFCSSFIFGYVMYRGYEVCPTYSMVNYHLGKYPSFGIMMGSVVSSTLGGVLGGILLFYLGDEYQIIPKYLLGGLKHGDYSRFPLSSFFGEAFLSFLYSLGVSIVCRVGPGFFGAAEISWFSNANIGIIANSMRAPGNLSLTYSALYGAYSGDYIGAIILGAANVAGTMLMNLLLMLTGDSIARKGRAKRKVTTKSKQK
ncbi:transmembrane domain-containing protein [Cryptosporidium canis]|uniref:Transmembrane domain-containing protein n=1 Tax=Cryptosporidium canis TaxID=195482 RepID=A0ABQ8P9U1_9CRYT|nr:transmembrane domain-containing protein [Cryptosporidium canis]